MSREKALVKNTAIITIGKVCTQLITFFLLPVYTAMLSTAEYGTVDLLNTLISLLLPIITFQIEQAVFRNLLDNREKIENQKSAITTTLVIVTLQSFLYLILFLIISPLIKNEYKYFLATNVIANIFSSVLLEISIIKQLAKKKYITKIQSKMNGVVFTYDSKKFDNTCLSDLIQKYGNKIKFSSGIKPMITLKIDKPGEKELIKQVKTYLVN